MSGFDPPPWIEPGTGPVDPILSGQMPPGTEHLRPQVEALLGQGASPDQLNAAFQELRRSGQLGATQISEALRHQGEQLQAAAGPNYWNRGVWRAYSDTSWGCLAYNAATQTYGWSLERPNRDEAERQALEEAGEGAIILATGKERTFAIGRHPNDPRIFWASAGPNSYMQRELAEAYTRETGVAVDAVSMRCWVEIGGTPSTSRRLSRDVILEQHGSYGVSPEAIAERAAEQARKDAAWASAPPRTQDVPTAIHRGSQQAGAGSHLPVWLLGAGAVLVSGVLAGLDAAGWAAYLGVTSAVAALVAFALKG